MSNQISVVTCLVCGWQKDTQGEIESANWYGECLECNESFLRWDFEDGAITVTNGKTDEEIKWDKGQEWK